MTPSTISKERLAALAAKLKAARTPVPEPTPIPSPIQEAVTTYTSSLHEDRESELFQVTDKYGNLITYNAKQQEFISLVSSGQSCVLIGAAGTGKTTCQKGATQALIQSGKAGILEADGHKVLQSGTPGIVICAFTRRAVSNIRMNLPPDLQNNCLTIHALLEYEPVYFEVLDPQSGKYKSTMRFEPRRSATNPLPASIHTIIFEETSMLGTDLHQQVVDACPHNPQMIYLGDIQQLPPVFGPAILGFKLLSLPVVELTEVYRQALESPIIALAHRILSGKGIPAKELPNWKLPGLNIRPWKKKIDPFMATTVMANVFVEMYNSNLYDPQEDMILIPFNKNFGTDELNKHIATHLSKVRGSEVWEIIAGFRKIYLSIGDKILVDKEDAIITDIYPNPAYGGAPARPPSKSLDYWGHQGTEEQEEDSGDDMDFLLAQVASQSSQSEERVKKASHVICYRRAGSETDSRMDSAGDINAILLGYCLTVHKAQGSEWNRVFFLMHLSHAVMNSRELLYTAVTRAKKELVIMCEPDTLERGIENPRIKGNTLAEKAEYFKGKAKQMSEKELT